MSKKWVFKETQRFVLFFEWRWCALFSGFLNKACLILATFYEILKIGYWASGVNMNLSLPPHLPSQFSNQCVSSCSVWGVCFFPGCEMWLFTAWQPVLGQAKMSSCEKEIYVDLEGNLFFWLHGGWVLGSSEGKSEVGTNVQATIAVSWYYGPWGRNECRDYALKNDLELYMLDRVCILV